MAACRARPGLQERRGEVAGRGMAHCEKRLAALVGQIIATIRELVRVCKHPLYCCN
jgi:hypothetical protein